MVDESESLCFPIIKKEDVFSIIFSHEFAKAFWGEEWPKDGLRPINPPPRKFHLQHMGLEPEPLKYLEQFL